VVKEYGTLEQNTSKYAHM